MPPPPAARSSATGARSTPAAGEQLVGVGDVGVGQVDRLVERAPCRPARARPGGSAPWAGCLASTTAPRRGELRVGGRPRPRSWTGATQVSAPAELGHPLVAVRGAKAAPKSGADRVLDVVVVLVVDPLLAPERPAQVGEELALDGRRPPAICRRAAAVGVVAGVATGEHVVSRAGLGPGGQVLVDGQRHEPQDPVGHRHVEVGALAAARPGRRARRTMASAACIPPAGRVGDGGPGHRRAAVGTGPGRRQEAPDGQVVEVVAGPADARPVLAEAARRAVDDAGVHAPAPRRSRCRAGRPRRAGSSRPPRRPPPPAPGRRRGRRRRAGRPAPGACPAARCRRRTAASTCAGPCPGTGPTFTTVAP